MTHPPSPQSGILRQWTHWLGSAQGARVVLELVVIVALFTTTVGERTWIAVQREIMPAGDTFNFQSIAMHLRQGTFPQGERRLPGYAFAMLLGMELGMNPVVSGIVVSILCAGGTIVLLYLIGRRIGIPKLPLATILLLTSLAPLLSANDIRPLSDSFFLFLVLLSIYAVMRARPSLGSALGVGALLAALTLTRYEGPLLAIPLLLALRLRVPWKHVVIATSVPFVAGLLWLPVMRYSAGGSFSNFAYFQEAKADDRGNSPAQIAHEYGRILKEAGWGNAWNTVHHLTAGTPEARQELREQFSSSGWQLSVLGILGVLWLLFAGRKNAVPLVVSFLFYPLLPAWWFVYGRYIAPITAVYMLTVAAGAGCLWLLLRRITGRSKILRGIALTGLTVLLLMTIFAEARPLFNSTLARAFDNNGAGVAFYQAIRAAEKEDATIVGMATSDSIFPYLTFGTIERPKDGINVRRGVYLSDRPTASTEELFSYFTEHRVSIIVDSGEASLVPLLELLRARNILTSTEPFESHLPDGTVEHAALHRLSWTEGSSRQ